MTGYLRAAFCVSMFSVLAAPGLAQSSPAAPVTLQARSNLVIVDVVVKDKSHNPVHGLKASDFQVKENGAPQIVKNFEEHSVIASATPVPALPALPPGVFSNMTATAVHGPVNVLLIDRLNTPISDQSVLRQQLIEFLKKMKPGTQIAVFGLTTQLVYLQGFTSDPKLLLAALESKKNNPRDLMLLSESISSSNGQGGGVSDDMLMAAQMSLYDADLQSFATQLRVRYTLDGMTDLARYLSAIPGRKNVVWFSGSFPISLVPDADYTATGTADAPQAASTEFSSTFDMGDSVATTVNALGKAQVAVYPVDARGIQTPAIPSLSTASVKPGQINKQMAAATQAFNKQLGDETITMHQIADETGGEANTNTNDLAGAAEKDIDDGSNYYTLAYTPTDARQDGKFRGIHVGVEGKSVELNYRRGYYADNAKVPLNLAQASATPVIAGPMRAMLHGMPAPSEIVFKTFVGPASEPDKPTVAPANFPSPGAKAPFREYNVNFAAAPKGLTYTKVSEGNYSITVEFLVMVYDSNGGLVNHVDETLNVTLSRDQIAAMVRTGLTFHELVSAPAKGEYFLRIGVRDGPSNRIGSMEVPVAAVKGLPVTAPKGSQ